MIGRHCVWEVAARRVRTIEDAADGGGERTTRICLTAEWKGWSVMFRDPAPPQIEVLNAPRVSTLEVRVELYRIPGQRYPSRNRVAIGSVDRLCSTTRLCSR
eukprot:GHVU01176948.1.p1 GENE.GHVU01176948.1~~GHVU01176948.1.p1  ORF type:complete len:102 (-),score=4.00 GHVU01176948.1:276-581(-)